jgi:hypothetical protein
MNTLRDLLEFFESYYSELKFKKNLFKHIPSKKNSLLFGFICPGAIKTIDYLEKYKKQRKIVDLIKRVTDALFFLEIIVIYKDYINKSTHDKVKRKIKTHHCDISKEFIDSITFLFNLLPKYISKNMPDNFYHIRHHTLICSNDKKLALERIKLLQNIYSESVEEFTTMCNGYRDGVSGCRKCCKKKIPNKYDACVSNCMNY